MPAPACFWTPLDVSRAEVDCFHPTEARLWGARRRYHRRLSDFNDHRWSRRWDGKSRG